MSSCSCLFCLYCLQSPGMRGGIAFWINIKDSRAKSSESGRWEDEGQKYGETNKYGLIAFEYIIAIFPSISIDLLGKLFAASDFFFFSSYFSPDIHRIFWKLLNWICSSIQQIRKFYALKMWKYDAFLKINETSFSHEISIWVKIPGSAIYFSKIVQKYEIEKSLNYYSNYIIFSARRMKIAKYWKNWRINGIHGEDSQKLI